MVNFKNPVGTKSITANGTYDVTDYASASVSVSNNWDSVSVSRRMPGANAYYYSDVYDTLSTSSKYVLIRSGYVSNGGAALGATATVVIQGSNDNSSWTDITSASFYRGPRSSNTLGVQDPQTTTFRYIRIGIKSTDAEETLSAVGWIFYT